MGHSSVLKQIFLFLTVVTVLMISIAAFAKKDYFDFTYDDKTGYDDQEKNYDEDEYEDEIDYPSTKKTTVTRDDNLELGLLKIVEIKDDSVPVPSSFNSELYRELLNVAQTINAVPHSVLTHEILLKHISKKMRSKVELCLYNHICLMDILTPANLDLLVIPKLRYLRIPQPQNGEDKDNQDNSTIEYNCFVKIVNPENGRVLREFVVADTDHTELPLLLRNKFHKELQSLGLISKKVKKTSKK